MRQMVLASLLALLLSSVAQGWGGQGHRIVGLIAADRLTPVARQNVAWLLDKQTLADVATWADDYRDGVYQTFYWHFLNIPPTATAYDRDRDCPRQPGVAAGSRADTWRDCAVDRILYNQQRLADSSLDRADRSIALKFLVHFVGDLHQPFHALGVEAGGNGIFVSWFGSDNCGNDPAKPIPCNLHSVWDSRMIARRGLGDTQYVAVLEQLIRQNLWEKQPAGTPAEWATQSFVLGKAALVPQKANIDEPYYKAHMRTIDQRLALAGLRLAAMLNTTLTTPPL